MGIHQKVLIITDGRDERRCIQVVLGFFTEMKVWPRAPAEEQSNAKTKAAQLPPRERGQLESSNRSWVLPSM
jgi:hypothetical protein